MEKEDRVLEEIGRNFAAEEDSFFLNIYIGKKEYKDGLFLNRLYVGSEDFSEKIIEIIYFMQKAVREFNLNSLGVILQKTIK